MKNSLKITSLLFLVLLASCTSYGEGERSKNSEPAVAAQPPPQLQSQPRRSYKSGDIIFQKSLSPQSAALREATGSEWTHVGILVKKDSKWYVSEEIGPAVMTPLQTFINRGKDKAYRVYRWKFFDAETQSEALLLAMKKYNKPYDIFFEWSDDREYCSEFVHKVMLEVTGKQIGKIQAMKELKTDGPYVHALVEQRYTKIGKTLDPNEPIISPISEMNDPDLTFIEGTPLANQD